MVLVMGATGILGRVVVLELLKRGKTVRAARRAASNLEDVRRSYRFYTADAEDFFSRIEWINIDFEDISSLQKALEHVEEVYHCAAAVSFDPVEDASVYKTNIGGTQQLLYACENSSVKKFCFVSSIAVLDGVNERGEMDEESNFNPKLDHSAYAISKHLSEMEVWRAAAEGMQIVIINPGMVIGSGNWQRSSGELFPTFERSRFTFPGGASYVDVRDVARIAVYLMEKNIFGERFILISEARKYADLATKVRAKLGLKPPQILPEKFLSFAPVLGTLFRWLIPVLRLANTANIAAVTSFVPISNKKITETLNWKFIPVDESVDFHLKNYINDKNFSG